MALIGPGGRPVQSSAGASAAAPAESSAFIKDANLESFTADVLDASREVPVIVDFWAPWCGPCRSMAPAYEQATAALEPFIRVVKVDTEAEQGLGATYGIRSIPTLMLIHGGREIRRQAGAMDARRIIEWARG